MAEGWGRLFQMWGPESEIEQGRCFLFCFKRHEVLKLTAFIDMLTPAVN